MTIILLKIDLNHFLHLFSDKYQNILHIELNNDNTHATDAIPDEDYNYKRIDNESITKDKAQSVKNKKPLQDITNYTENNNSHKTYPSTSTRQELSINDKVLDDEIDEKKINEVTEEILHDEGEYKIPENDYSYLTDTSNTEDLPFHNVDWNVTKTQSPSEAKSSSDICTVCLTNERTHAFVPCGHLACCVTCIKRLEAKRCPICNNPYETYIRIRKP
ncbi:E3 ubiquitin-protein ligase cblA-like [Cardiocondyla obscurior]|uniref:E3 ubiquitin-protein ligase cblA-like n=1 Tax=Cardiocondyla obscurior TaxID=286306 RepID=UPI0039657CBD